MLLVTPSVAVVSLDWMDNSIDIKIQDTVHVSRVTIVLPGLVAPVHLLVAQPAAGPHLPANQSEVSIEVT